jgi:D-arginine dehydrogenase
MNRADVIIIGGGIGGLSIAAELAVDHSVILLEAEAALGFHATGRSGASFGRSYGNSTVLQLNELALPFFQVPPAGFAEAPLIIPRPWLIIARPDQVEAAAQWRSRDTGLRELSGSEIARQTGGLLKRDYADCAFLDESCGDIDVHGLTEGYRRMLRAAEGAIMLSANVSGIARGAEGWVVETGAGSFSAPIIVNAAGAWADKVGEMFGVQPLGLVPHRRTAALIDPPSEINAAILPVVLDAEEGFYFKPEAGKLMISPADETPSEPCDAQAEEIDIAYAVHYYEVATGQQVRSVSHKWAGLRTFAPDKTPVLGFDPRCEGLFWLAGQGGYGLQIAPALAKLGAAVIGGRAENSALLDALSPARLIAKEQEVA